MGFMEKLTDLTGHGMSSVLRTDKGIVSDESGGVGTSPLHKSASIWKSEDGSSPANVVLRALQIFFAFINLCIYIAIAAFQKKWQVGISFMTSIALFFVIEPLVVSALVLSAVLFYETIKPFRGIVRLMIQIRAAFIINCFHAALLLIAATATTISANVGGCKNRDQDAHKDLKGYVDAMGPFCRNKRAGAAFFWLAFLAWFASLALTLLEWYDIRKNPASNGFVPPSAQEDEIYPGPPDSRPSQSFYEGDRRLFANQGTYHDPFADQQPLSNNNVIYDHDPYEAIRQSMEVGHRMQ